MPRLPRIWQLILANQTNNFHCFRLPATPHPSASLAQFPVISNETPYSVARMRKARGHRRVAMLCREAHFRDRWATRRLTWRSSQWRELYIYSSDEFYVRSRALFSPVHVLRRFPAKWRSRMSSVWYNAHRGRRIAQTTVGI